MLYMTTRDGTLKIIVLESANLDELRKGRPTALLFPSALV